MPREGRILRGSVMGPSVMTLPVMALSVLTLLVGGLLTLSQAQAQTPERRREVRNVIEVSLGGSSILKLGGTTGKITLTDPTIAEITPAGDGLLVIGRKVGETNLILHSGGSQDSWLVKVSLPAQAIQSELLRIFPREDIEARAVGGALVLTGTVGATNVVTQAEELAIGYLRSPAIAGLGVQPNVINLLQVRTRQQVQIEVKFAEVNRRSLLQIGVNIVGGANNGRVGAAVGEGAQADVNPRAALNGIPQAPVVGRPAQVFSPGDNGFGSIFFGIPDGAFPFAATLNLLALRNLSKTLAEPTLVAMSGQEASFLAGGELPFQTSGSLGTTNIELKPYGIELKFSPTVLGDDTVQLKAEVSVSAIDVANTKGVNEAFKKRSASTVIRMRDGQSFAIAGLLNDEIENTISKVPGLGDLPILGALFSSKKFERRETELVIVVTARLVDPMDSDVAPSLPGEDTVTDPTDLELFLLNIQEADGAKQPHRMSGPQASIGPSRIAPSRQVAGKVGFWR